MHSQDSDGTPFLSEERKRKLVETLDGFSDVETVDFVLTAFLALGNHSEWAAESGNPKMGNCVDLARIGFLVIGTRLLPEGTLDEAISRMKEGRPISDADARWDDFLGEHPEL